MLTHEQYFTYKCSKVKSIIYRFLGFSTLKTLELTERFQNTFCRLITFKGEILSDKMGGKWQGELIPIYQYFGGICTRKLLCSGKW